MQNEQDCTQKLIDMGCTKEMALKFTEITGGNVQHAAELFLQGDEFKTVKDKEPKTEVKLEPEELKVVLCVRNDLGMGKGKMCAQSAHAAVGTYRSIIFGKNETHKKWLADWEQIGEAKIAVKVESEKELLSVQSEAHKIGLPTFLIADLGRTQIPSGSKTVLAVGPAPVSIINKVTSHLKLL
jgi:PTH2 family peptidyl-tRNA hydrolase